jgi:hypothetical protein
MVNRPLFFHRWPFLFPLFSHSSIFTFGPPNFQFNHLIVFFRFGPYVFLFEIIYKIEICFHFLHPSVFFICQINPHFFDCYLFYFRGFLKLIFFLQFHPPLVLYTIKFDHYSFDCYFFTSINFLNWYFFSISSSNIKLVRNWASWLSSDLRF